MFLCCFPFWFHGVVMLCRSLGDSLQMLSDVLLLGWVSLKKESFPSILFSFRGGYSHPCSSASIEASHQPQNESNPSRGSGQHHSMSPLVFAHCGGKKWFTLPYSIKLTTKPSQNPKTTTSLIRSHSEEEQP